MHSESDSTSLPMPGWARAGLLVGLSLGALGGGAAWACGGGTVPPQGTPVGEEPYNRASHVAIQWEGSSLDGPATIAISTDVVAAQGGFAFLIPVPQAPAAADIGLVEAEAFDWLATYTGPRLIDLGCDDLRPATELACPVDQNGGGDGGGGGFGAEEAAGVEVQGRYTVGDYELVVLDALGAEGLLRYLEGEGLAVPGAMAPVLDGYIDSGFSFVAVRVPASVEVADGDRLPALSFRFSAGLRSLPLLLGAATAREVQDVFLYLSAPRMGILSISNLPEVEPSRGCLVRDGDAGAFVEAELAAHHAAAGGPVWQREYHQVDLLEAPSAVYPATRLSPEAYAFVSPFAEGDAGRLHLRFGPGELSADPVFYAPNQRLSFDLRYHAYAAELTEFLPVCGEGRVSEGSCPPTEIIDNCEDAVNPEAGKGEAGCATVAPRGVGGLALGLLPVGALLARRRRALTR